MHDLTDSNTLPRHRRKIREDERQRLVRYRAGFYAFVAMAAVSYLCFISGIFFSEDAFRLDPVDLSWVAFWFCMGGGYVFMYFYRSASRELEEETRQYNNETEARRRGKMLWLLGWSLLGNGVMFVLLWKVGELDPLRAGLMCGLVAAGMIGYNWWKYLRRPGAQEERSSTSEDDCP